MPLEYGFQHWADRVRHVETINPPGLKTFEQMADVLAAASLSGDFEAIPRIQLDVWHVIRLASRTGRDATVNSRCGSHRNRAPNLAVSDARALRARKRGVDTWDELFATAR